MCFCPVAGKLDYRVQASLGDVLQPVEITSHNQDDEKHKQVVKLVTEQYNAYRGNYSGNIKFDINDGSKIFF